MYTHPLAAHAPAMPPLVNVATAGIHTARPEGVRAKIIGWSSDEERKARTPGKQGGGGAPDGDDHQEPQQRHAA